MNNKKIVVTSRSFSAHPKLREELLSLFPNTKFNDRGAIVGEKDLAKFLSGADGAIVALDPIKLSLLNQCPDLKIISKFGVGMDNVDREACKITGVSIGWTGGLNRRGVAEMALCYMIGLSRHIFFSARDLRGSNSWIKDGGQDLSSKTIGIIGVGYVGKELIGLLRGFGCKILVNDIIDQKDYYKENKLLETNKEEIFKTADIITVHTPLDSSTEKMFTEKVFSLMKQDSFLINVARGGIVDQLALKKALMGNDIAGAAIDVFEMEPCDDFEFLQLPNKYCTPHTGGSSEQSMLAMGRSAINHLKKYFGL